MPRRTLTRVEQRAVAAALADGPDMELLAEHNGILVSRADMATLGPQQWMNDEVDNAFLQLQEKHHAAAGAASNSPKAEVFQHPLLREAGRVGDAEHQQAPVAGASQSQDGVRACAKGAHSEGQPPVYA